MLFHFGTTTWVLGSFAFTNCPSRMVVNESLRLHRAHVCHLLVVYRPFSVGAVGIHRVVLANIVPRTGRHAGLQFGNGFTRHFRTTTRYKRSKFVTSVRLVHMVFQRRRQATQAYRHGFVTQLHLRHPTTNSPAIIGGRVSHRFVT